MKKILLFVVLIITGNSLKAQSFYPWTLEGFPQAMIHLDSIQCLWEIGSPSKSTFTSAYSVPNVIVTDTLMPYPNQSDCFFQLSIPLPYSPTWYFNFDHQYDTEAGKDGGWIEYYDYCTDEWKNILQAQMWDYCYAGVYGIGAISGIYSANDTLQNGTPAFSGSSNGWQNVGFQFYCMAVFQDPDGGQRGGSGDTLKLRFRFSSDSVNTNQDGWMIDNFLITVDNGICSSVEELSSAMDLKILPNPATDFIQIQKKDGSSFQGETISIFDIHGKCLSKEIIRGNSYHYNCSTIPPGIYSYRISGRDNKVSHGTWIKE